jgi:N6-adenosine-specific RNA methylase IME4
MTQQEIKAISIPTMLEDNAIVFLWTTNKFLFDAKELLDHWGLQYKCMLTWNKVNMGMGYWFRLQCEFCLMAIKGKPEWKNTKWRDLIEEKRRAHSQKPEAFYDIILELTAGKRLDYFSRQERKGFVSYGNDINKFTEPTQVAEEAVVI